MKLESPVFQREVKLLNLSCRISLSQDSVLGLVFFVLFESRSGFNSKERATSLSRSRVTAQVIVKTLYYILNA